MGLAESDAGGDVCAASGDGRWISCGAIDKFGGGTLTAGGTRVTTVTLENTGTSSAQLFVLPSQCSDSVTGAHGALCETVTVTVSCGGATAVPTRTLNGFHDQRNYPTGYPAGTLAAGTSTTCDFTLVASAIPQQGTVSQPISWKLSAGA